MRFNPGYRIKVGQREFSVTGRISYRGNDGSVWDEYSLRDASGRTAWLSVDDEEGEYILSEATGLQHPPEGFSLYWQGSERVTGVSGRVDVEPGDEAVCSDYEDHSGRIYSVERWDDETEYSLGTILDPDKIIRISGRRGRVDAEPSLPQELIRLSQGCWHCTAVCSGSHHFCPAWK